MKYANAPSLSKLRAFDIIHIMNSYFGTLMCFFYSNPHVTRHSHFSFSILTVMRAKFQTRTDIVNRILCTNRHY